MALVAYDNSDSSDYEDEDDDNTPVVLLNNKTESKHEISQIKSEISDEEPETIFEKPVMKIKEENSPESGPSLFNFLPKPSTKKNTVIEEDDEFLHKKEVANAVKPRAKITVPSLSDFKDVENSTPIAKPRAANGKKSGLLSMLPQPRNGVIATTKSLIPHVLTKKPATPVNVKKETVPSKKSKVESAPLINDYSDDSDNDEVQNDFFSINKPIELPEIVDLPLDIEQNVQTEIKKIENPTKRGIESYFKKEEVVNIEPEFNSYNMEQQTEASSSYNSYEAETTSSNNFELDEEAIMKLCGARGKRRREEIQIVDVNQQEVLADAKEMLLKGLMDDTTKRVSASKKKGNEPTTQQRRKHQITYLAHQAKANEAELQNQWANNRMSRRQTQAKYGF